MERQARAVRDDPPSAVGEDPREAYARVADLQARAGIVCTGVQRISQRTEPCSPEVAALPYHYQAEFTKGPARLSLEISTAEAYPEPEPALFLLQACLTSLIVRGCPDLEAWRALMGVGPLDSDVAMYHLARQQAQALAALFSRDQLDVLEHITLDQLGPPDDPGDQDA